MLYIIISILLTLASVGSAYAACVPVSSGVWRTDGNEAADVQECISDPSVVAGDTINVIAGTGSATWTNYVTINKGVKIVGPGADNLNIYYTGVNRLFQVSDGVDNWELSGFHFHWYQPATSGLDYHYMMYIYGSTGWRIYDNIWTGNPTNGNDRVSHVFILHGTSTNPVVTGLFDSNTCYDVRLLHYNENINSQAGWGGLWYSDAVLGAADTSYEAVFIENNYFYMSPGNTLNFYDSNRGARYVFRYNTCVNAGIMAHTWQDYGRGTRTWEVYGNDFIDNDTSAWTAALYQRGGTGVVFSNKFNSGFTANGNNILFTYDRSVYTHLSHSDNLTAYGYCDGDHVGDGNTNPNPASGYIDGWPCRDQIGRGKDATLWTTCQTGAGPAQALVPVYLWSNYQNTTPATVYVESDSNTNYNSTVTGLTRKHIVANRDFYDYKTSFTGTSGVGCGASLPSASGCVDGVGFFVPTNINTMPCDGSGDNVGQDPVTPMTGTLYKCSSGSWVAYYSPHAYPHPSRGETEVDITAPIVDGCTISTNGTTATMTFSESVVMTDYDTGEFNLDCTSAGSDLNLSSPSGSGTSWSFTISNTIGTMDVCNLDFTGDANSIEDTSANDLAAFYNTSVTNSSTVDLSSPVVAITSPTSLSTYSTSVSTITLSGTSSTDTSYVTYSLASGGNGNCTGTSSWTCSSISLTAGSNVISVNAYDGSGNLGTDAINVTYTPPTNTGCTIMGGTLR